MAGEEEKGEVGDGRGEGGSSMVGEREVGEVEDGRGGGNGYYRGQTNKFVEIRRVNTWEKVLVRGQKNKYVGKDTKYQLTHPVLQRRRIMFQIYTESRCKLQLY